MWLYVIIYQQIVTLGVKEKTEISIKQ